ncbi:hypothetical protein [Microcoleus sp.]|uniref:hypothetical protein n=1 Tax=Microcoleus sp. TaxID=44472 RepID=UPI003593AD46
MFCCRLRAFRPTSSGRRKKEEGRRKKEEGPSTSRAGEKKEEGRKNSLGRTGGQKLVFL